MKEYFGIIVLTLFIGCNSSGSGGNNKNNHTVDTVNIESRLVISENCAILLYPDSTEQVSMQKRHIDDTYEEIMSDIVYYHQYARELLERLGVNTISCNQQTLFFITSTNNQIELNCKDLNGNIILFRTDKVPVICSSTSLDKRRIIQYFDIKEISQDTIDAKANEFVEHLRNGKELSSFFSDNWTLVFHSDNRYEGSTDGKIENLRSNQIDSIIKIQVKNDGDGWLLEVIGEKKREQQIFEMDFSLKKQVKNWDRFETVRYENQLNSEIFVQGAGESDILELHYNRQKQIVRLEYRSEDPG